MLEIRRAIWSSLMSTWTEWDFYNANLCRGGGLAPAARREYGDVTSFNLAASILNQAYSTAFRQIALWQSISPGIPTRAPLLDTPLRIT